MPEVPTSIPRKGMESPEIFFSRSGGRSGAAVAVGGEFGLGGGEFGLGIVTGLEEGSGGGVGFEGVLEFGAEVNEGLVGVGDFLLCGDVVGIGVHGGTFHFAGDAAVGEDFLGFGGDVFLWGVVVAQGVEGILVGFFFCGCRGIGGILGEVGGGGIARGLQLGIGVGDGFFGINGVLGFFEVGVEFGGAVIKGFLGFGEIRFVGIDILLVGGE